MYKKILIPIDGSGYSLKALHHAAKLAEHTGALITIFHVMELPEQLKSLKSYPLLKKQTAENGEMIIREAGEICASYKVITCDSKMIPGVPADEIIREEKHGGYDLLVIGSRGMGDVKGWLLGSVSRKVVRHAECPVLVIK